MLCNTIHTVHCKEIRSYTRGREEGITGGPMCKRRHAHISIQEFAYTYIETIRNLCSYRLISSKPIRNRSNLRRNLYSHSWRNRCSLRRALSTTDPSPSPPPFPAHRPKCIINRSYRTLLMPIVPNNSSKLQPASSSSSSSPLKNLISLQCLRNGVG